MTILDPLDLRRAIRAAARERLYVFLWKAFEYLHPGVAFTQAAHLEAVSYALERVVRGDLKRLLITLPPRYGKSICAAVCAPAWALGHNPTLKIMVANYGSEFGLKHARDFRSVVESDWYGELFPNMRLAADGNRADEQITTAAGGRKMVSLGGALTGFGADWIIVDDLMKASDAASAVERQKVRDYYEKSLFSHLNNKAEGVIIAIQQRLHEDDLPGYLIETGQFEHLNLAAIAQTDEVIKTGPRTNLRRAKGSPLWPVQEPLSVLEQIRREMGASAFSAQYLQDPTPPGGNRMRWEWFGSYEQAPDRSQILYVAQSWDTGMTAEPTSDFSVGTTWGFHNGHWYLLDLVRERLDFPDLKRRVHSRAEKHRVDLVPIEKAGSSFALLQQLRNERRWERAYRAYTPKTDKLTRFEAQTARLETGRYLIPASAPWLDALRQEMLAFPNAKHDDQVDSVIQFVEWSGNCDTRRFVERHPVTNRPLRVVRPSRSGPTANPMRESE